MGASFTSVKKTRSNDPAFRSCNTGLAECGKSWVERALRGALAGNTADGLSFFFNRNNFDVVITEDYRVAILFGLLTRIFGRRSKHVVKELYLDEAVLGNRWKRWLFRVALKEVDCVIVNARSERISYASFLGVGPDRVVFLAWPSNIPLCEEGDNEGYVFAAGRSMRDWKTLFESARSLPVPLVVVASRSDVASLAVPVNMSVHCDVSRQKYLELLRGALVVVLPLESTVRSTGQAVALEAMAMRKALVAADSPGILDYVKDEYNGLLYRAGDSASLCRQLQRILSEPELRRRLIEGAAESIRTLFNTEEYSRQLRELLSRLVHGEGA